MANFKRLKKTQKSMLTRIAGGAVVRHECAVISELKKRNMVSETIDGWELTTVGRAVAAPLMQHAKGGRS